MLSDKDLQGAGGFRHRKWIPFFVEAFKSAYTRLDHLTTSIGRLYVLLTLAPVPQRTPRGRSAAVAFQSQGWNRHHANHGRCAIRSRIPSRTPAPCAFAAALCNRQRFFVAAMILAIPSLLIRRLGFGAFGVAGNVPLIAAHRFFCASAIRRRVAAVRLRVGTSGVAVSPPPPESMARSSTILPSMRVFSTSYPMMAAVMSSGSSFVGIDASIE